METGDDEMAGTKSVSQLGTEEVSAPGSSLAEPSLSGTRVLVCSWSDEGDQALGIKEPVG